jgi:OmpA-OmpF porin, OOP family
MKVFRVVVCTFLCVAVLAGCRKESAPNEPTAASTPSAPVAAEPTSAPAPDQPIADASTSAAAAEFDVNSVPVTSASLPPFPFFKDPEGLSNVVAEKDRIIPFNRHYFIAGKTLRAEEGKLSVAKYNLEHDPSGRKYSALEFHRNFENAVTSLGGKKISATQYNREFVAANGGSDEIQKYQEGAGATDWGTEHHDYLVRTADKEYWINISTGVLPLHGFVVVLEKQAMQSSIGFLDASAMKKALDQDGRVALYINFDIDKASIRPDAQPVIDEINKLMSSNPELKLSIEGHTDSTGNADHNRTLSNNRARSVLGALVGLGIDPARLSSKGFGPDKPLADNGSEDGRAKNRRVELVKVQ